MSETILHVERRRSGGVGPTTWEPDESVDFASWIQHGRRLGAVGRGVSWWIGDWLRYGNVKFGEKYSRAARITGYDPQSLMNMAYVASRFAPERRRAEISWSHHAEVAALPPAEQDKWLDLAQRNRISVGSLRQELRSARRANDPDDRPSDQGTKLAPSTSRVVCPACQFQIDLARDLPPSS